MVYCSNCGEKIADDANFCPKCGTKTPKGKTSNVSYPGGELHDAFYSVGVELVESIQHGSARNTRSHNESQRKPPTKTSSTRNYRLLKMQHKEYFGRYFLQ